MSCKLWVMGRKQQSIAEIYSEFYFYVLNSAF